MKKTNQIEFRIEKEIKKKRDKLYVKWREYGNLFNSLIDEKDCFREWAIFSFLEPHSHSKNKKKLN